MIVATGRGRYRVEAIGAGRFRIEQMEWFAPDQPIAPRPNGAAWIASGVSIFMGEPFDAAIQEGEYPIERIPLFDGKNLACVMEIEP